MNKSDKKVAQSNLIVLFDYKNINIFLYKNMCPICILWIDFFKMYD